MEDLVQIHAAQDEDWPDGLAAFEKCSNGFARVVGLEEGIDKGLCSVARYFILVGGAGDEEEGQIDGNVSLAGCSLCRATAGGASIRR